MKLLPILLLVSGALCFAQDASMPATTNVPGAEFPRINPDLSVTFRLKAPGAHKVQVQLGGNFDMTRSEDGVWTGTVPPQVP